MIRRKRKLIRADMQLKVVLITLFVGCLALLVNFQLNLAGLWSLEGKVSPLARAPAVLDTVQQMFVNRFILAVVIAVPLATAIGVVYSFRFAGPIYKFKKYFLELAAGRLDQPVSLRKGDQLVDVSAAINEALDQVRSRLRSNHELFVDLESFFKDAGFTADGAGRTRLAQLRERMARESAWFAERFPSPVISTSTQPTVAASASAEEREPISQGS